MTTGTMKIENGELAYEISGTGSPVVLLHGGILDGRMWDAQFAALERQHTVVRYDARSHGQSSTPVAHFSHDEDLRQLLTGLGIPKASLVGLSMGSRTSIDFALKYPEMVDKLLLASPGISGMIPHDPFVLAQLEKLAEAGAARDLPAAVECLLRMWVDGPSRVPEEMDQQVRAQCRDLMSESLTRHGAAAQIWATELSAIDHVGELRAPILVILGALDPVDIHEVVDLLDRKAPQSHKIVFPGAAHMVNLEDPEVFNLAMLDFLGDSAGEG